MLYPIQSNPIQSNLQDPPIKVHRREPNSFTLARFRVILQYRTQGFTSIAANFELRLSYLGLCGELGQVVLRERVVLGRVGRREAGLILCEA